MSDEILRCYECRTPLNPHGSPARVELNPSGRSAGFHTGNLCEACEEDLVEKLKPTTGGNV